MLNTQAARLVSGKAYLSSRHRTGEVLFLYFAELGRAKVVIADVNSEASKNLALEISASGG